MTLPNPIDYRQITGSRFEHERWHESLHGVFNNDGLAVATGTRYVAENGNDNNDGLSWPTAFASPQAAVDNLVAYATANYTFINGRVHAGKVVIGPHTTFFDVGEGLVFNKNYAMEIIGVTTSRATAAYTGQSALGTTSATATELINLTTSPNAYGFEFRNLTFLVDMNVNTSIEQIILADDCNQFTVTDNYARASNGPLEGYFIKMTGSLDSSWWTIENNRISNMGLLTSAGTTTNQNRSWVAHNQIFFSSAGVLPMINLEKWDDALFINNNIEGQSIGIFAKNCGSCTFIENAGEATNSDDPFYKFDGGFWNTIIGGRIQIPTSNQGIFLEQIGGTGTTIIHPAVSLDTITDGSKTNLSETVQGVITLYGRQVRVEGARAKRKASTSTLSWGDNVVVIDSDTATTVFVPDNAAFDGRDWVVTRDGSNPVKLILSGSDIWSDGNNMQTIATENGYIWFVSIGDGEYKIIDTGGTVTGSLIVRPGLATETDTALAVTIT